MSNPPHARTRTTGSGREPADWARSGGGRTLEAVFVVLLLALLCVPLLELYVIIQVADGVGTGQTILLLIVVSVVGAWMVRRSGLGVLNQIRTRLSRGELPAGELVDGLLILVAGALMLTPGFLTDAVGLLLLFPPTRLIVRLMLIRRFSHKITAGGWSTGPGGSGGLGFGFGPGGFPGDGSGDEPDRGHGRHGPDVRDVSGWREVRGPEAREDSDDA